MLTSASADIRSTPIQGWRLLGRVGLALTSGLLLCLPGLAPHLFALTWIGFVPLLLALQGASLRQAYLLGMLSGTVLWGGITYWLSDFIITFKGYSQPYSVLLAVAFWLYAGQSLGLVALAWQWLSRGRLPALLVVPTVFVVVFSLYPAIFNFRLAESQSQFPLALQGTDLIGALGLDAVILAVNLLLFQLLHAAYQRRFAGYALGGLTLLLGLWFGYGFERLQAWDELANDAPVRRIGLVQPNDPVSLKVLKPEAGYSRQAPRELEVSERLARAGADILFWPEARFKGYFYHRSVQAAYQQRVAGLNVPLVFHDVERVGRGPERRYYNSAVALNPNGQWHGTYRKIKRMPFGERLPEFFTWPLVAPLLQDYLGDFLRQISPGTAHATFALGGMRVVPKICYESADPLLVAEAIGDDGRGKVLAVLSQDGWFGKTQQPFQHLYSSVLRAVENRVPLVHVINNGPSGVVLPSGRMLYQSEAFVATEAVVDLPYDPERGGSFYSRHPQLIPWTSAALLTGLVFLRLLCRGRN